MAPVIVASLLSACTVRRPALPPNIPPISGNKRALYALEYIDVAQGTGALAELRKCAYVHYTGWLQDGTKFDSSRDTLPNGAPREPIAVPLGSRRVIPGWDTGFEGMRVGGKRRLFIPYQLGYGETGRGEIPPKAPLIFDIEVMAVADTLPRGAVTTGPPSCAEWSQVRR
jgi:peptidylprolyl isomerase